jgi:hypothetical protein
VCPVPGPQGLFITHNNLWKPIKESKLLEFCEEKPEIFGAIRHFAKTKENTFEDKMATTWLINNKIVTPSYLYHHSEMGEEAYKKALAKYNRKIDYHPHEASLMLAYEWTRRIYYPYCSNSRIIDLPLVTAKTNPTTSPGMPWKKIFSSKGQMWEDNYGRSVILDYIDQSRNPGGPRVIASTAKKGELRAAEKIEDKKLRLFIPMPGEHHAATATYSSDFNEKLMDAARQHKVPICVGMTIYDGNIAKMAAELVKCQEQIFADVGGFDSSTMSLMQLMCAAIRFDCLRKEDRTYANLCLIANTYRDVIMTPTVLEDGTIIMLPHTPSGHFNTAIDNSMILNMGICYSWISQGCGKNFDDFQKSVYYKLYGDDSVVGSYDGVFTSYIFQRGMRDLGFELEFSEHWEFLGHYIAWSKKLDTFVPIFPAARAIAGLMYAGKPDFYTCACKAMSLRLDTYTNDEVFPIIDAYCCYLLKHAGTYYDLLAPQYLSEADIVIMLKGRSPKLVKHCRTPFKVSVDTLYESDSKFTFQQEFMSSAAKPARAASSARTARNKRKRNKRKMRARSERPSGQVQNYAPRPRRVPQVPQRSQQIVRSSGPNNSITTKFASKFAGFGAGAVDAVSQMLDPFSSTNLVHFPNRGGVKCALFRSIRVVSIKSSPTINGGRWTVAIQPHLGDASQPQFFKVAQAKTTLTNPDYSLASTFESVVNGPDGQEDDIRLDPYYQDLTGSHVSQGTWNGAAFVGTVPFGTVPAINDQFSYGITPQVTFLNATTNRIFIPKGTSWSVSLYINFTNINNPAIVTSTNVAISTLVNQVAIAGGAIVWFYMSVWTAIATLPGPYFVDVASGAAWVSINNSTATFTPNFLPELFAGGVPSVPSPNNGDISQIRPVACAGLFTCTLNNFDNSGNVCAARLSGAQLATNFFVNQVGNSAGHLEYYENLARLGGVQNAKLGDGAYTFYVPEDNDDEMFYTPSKSLENSYPGLVFSGDWKPQNPTAGEFIIGKLTIASIYEFTTLDELYPQTVPNVLDDADFRAMIAYVQMCRSGVGNPNHWAWIKERMASVVQIAKNGYAWYHANRDIINPAVKLMAGALMI